MQELGKFDFKIKLIPNGSEKYISYSLDNKLVFIDSFQFLSSSLGSLVKNLGENEFEGLSKNEFYNSLTGKGIVDREHQHVPKSME